MGNLEVECGRITYKESKTGQGAKGPWTRIVYTLNGNKYSTFNSKFASFEQGDLVNINFEKSEDGKFNNITSMTKAEEKILDGEGFKPASSKNSEKEAVMWEKKDMRAARENALNNTSSLINTIALVTPEYLVKAFETEDPFKYLVDKAKEIVDFIYS